MFWIGLSVGAFSMLIVIVLVVLWADVLQPPLR